MRLELRAERPSSIATTALGPDKSRESIKQPILSRAHTTCTKPSDNNGLQVGQNASFEVGRTMKSIASQRRGCQNMKGRGGTTGSE